MQVNSENFVQNFGFRGLAVVAMAIVLMFLTGSFKMQFYCDWFL